MAGTQYWGTAYLGTTQSVAYSGTAGTITNNVGTETHKVRVCCTTDCYLLIGNSVTATTATGTYLPGLEPEYFTIRPGQTVSAIQVSAGGNLFVTECL